MSLAVRNVAGVAALSILAFGMAGCGGGGPAFAEVEGVVTKEGKPLGNVKVEFWPEKNGPVSSGITDASGKYVLKSNDDAKPGAVVGDHKILLRDLDMFGTKFMGRKAENMPDLSGGKKNRIPAAFSDNKSTKLKASVTAGTKNTHDLKAD